MPGSAPVATKWKGMSLLPLHHKISWTCTDDDTYNTLCQLSSWVTNLCSFSDPLPSSASPTSAVWLSDGARPVLINRSNPLEVWVRPSPQACTLPVKSLIFKRWGIALRPEVIKTCSFLYQSYTCRQAGTPVKYASDRRRHGTCGPSRRRGTRWSPPPHPAPRPPSRSQLPAPGRGALGQNLRLLPPAAKQSFC